MCVPPATPGCTAWTLCTPNASDSWRVTPNRSTSTALHPHRFDRELLFPLPDVTARASILRIHTRRWAAPPREELLGELAAAAVGYCGADLKVGHWGALGCVVWSLFGEDLFTQQPELITVSTWALLLAAVVGVGPSIPSPCVCMPQPR
jgi:hypothetical protein